MCTMATWSSEHWLSASITPRRRCVDFHCTWASFRQMVWARLHYGQAQADTDKKKTSAAWSHCKRLISTPKQPLRRRQSPLQSVGWSCISRTLWQLQGGRGVMIVCSQLIVKQTTTSPVAHFQQTLSPKTQLYKLGLSVGKTNANHKAHARARKARQGSKLLSQALVGSLTSFCLSCHGRWLITIEGYSCRLAEPLPVPQLKSS